MTTNPTAERAAGAWLAAASLLLVLVLALHGPLHPDLQMQMTRIAGAATRWSVAHWLAAAAFSCFTVAALLVLLSGSRLTGTGQALSAWAVVLVGALWTLTTAVTEATVISRLATAGDVNQFESWWSFAEGHANGFSFLALAVAVIAWNEIEDSRRYVPKWGAMVGAGAALASFAGWVLGVWFDIGPANLVWLLASGVMGLWLASLGVMLARTSQPRGLSAR